MDTESINNQIQAENDSYRRDRDRLQQELFNLRQRHESRISGLKQQKEQIKNLNKQENLVVQHKSSENIFVSVNEALKKFI